MRAWTDGRLVYTVTALGANCWKHIAIHRLYDWVADSGANGHGYQIMDSQHPLYSIVNMTAWTTTTAAESSLAEAAIELDWKEI